MIPDKPTLVKWKQVAAFRLSRHHLIGRAQGSDLLSVVSDMGGAQAQLLSAAQLSLWARVRDLQINDIEKAMRERKLVKAACMRRTLFLAPSDELAVFVQGSARRAEKEIRWTLGKGVPQRTVDAAIEAALGVLDEPLTRPEIAERVSRALGVQRQDVHGGGWGSRRKIAAVPVGDLTFPVVDLLHLVASRGVVCYGPSRGGEPTFVRADAWVPRWKEISREQAEDLLLRKYLRSYGPATVADFSLWTGMTLSEAREVWKRAQADLAPVDVEGWLATILAEDLDSLSQARFESSHTCLLPYFDTYLLGHRERTHLVALEHHLKVYRAQGWITPVVLVDGRVAALWDHKQEGRTLNVRVTKLGPLSRSAVTTIRERAEDLRRFLDLPKVGISIE